MEAQTFREAYGVLQEHAEKLREQTEPNIDDLLAIVTESVAAYKVCKERVDAVEKALKAALTDVSGDVGRAGAAPAGDDSGDEPEPPPRRVKASPAAKRLHADFDNMDDEIPF